MDLLGVSCLCICDKTHRTSNIVHTVVLWSVWKVRNDIFYNKSGWHDMQVVFRKVAYTLAHWELLCLEGEREKLWRISGVLEALACRAPADVAGTWLREQDGRIHQLVVRRVELDGIAPWVAKDEEEKEWCMTVGRLAATLEVGSMSLVEDEGALCVTPTKSLM
jgi:hypothetical protein